MFTDSGDLWVSASSFKLYHPFYGRASSPKETLIKLAALPRGLILVTGPTGAENNSSLASMIDYINNTRAVIL
jgi:type II secretory ATPase GspE/PulE/Tfp pilus assembly ATPase PilB-like protein